VIVRAAGVVSVKARKTRWSAHGSFRRAKVIRAKARRPAQGTRTRLALMGHLASRPLGRDPPDFDCSVRRQGRSDRTLWADEFSI